jgi:protoporphyrinogen oxidase
MVVAFSMFNDMMKENDKTEVDNLEQWFCCKFGNSLAKEYFIPYSEKIWGMPPKDMSPAWVEGKLPVPNKLEMFQSLLYPKNDDMSHSSFYYPNTN